METFQLIVWLLVFLSGVLAIFMFRNWIRNFFVFMGYSILIWKLSWKYRKNPELKKQFKDIAKGLYKISTNQEQLKD